MYKVMRLIFLLGLVMMVSCDIKTVSQPPIPVTWAYTGVEAVDVGTGAEGGTYIAGIDGKLYKYNMLTNSYAIIEGDFELPLIAKVDVDGDDTPYVVTRCGGQVYYLDSLNNWVQLPGCASDIGVGRGGEIWKTGCDARVGGFGVWKLFCKCKCKCNCSRQITRFRPQKYVTRTPAEQRTCYWYRIEGAGVRVDVDVDGNPWVVAENNSVYWYDGTNWKLVPGYAAQDITISNDNVAFAAGVGSSIGRLICPDLGTWQVLTGAAKSISAGPYSLPFIIDGADKVYTTAKKDLI